MEIAIPYQYQPRLYQLEFLQAPQRFKIAVIHRRGGKSKTALNAQIVKTQIARGVYYYFLPTYKQAKQVIWDELIKLHIPKEIVDKVNDSELAVYYKNGSIQRFAGCEDVDKHRGINALDVVFDEYSEMDERIWTEIVQPILRENKGTATFIFTPKGQNHAWRLIQAAQNNPNWFVTVKDVYETKAISEEELEQAKKDTPQALFQQEYECKFLEAAGAFFRRVRENVYQGDIQPEEGHHYKLGVDLAKYQDWTVITPFDLNTFKVGQQDRFNQVDWNLQKARIEAASHRFNRARVTVDSTGLGDPIADDLRNKGVPLEPEEGFKFTETSKRQLLDNLAILLEQDKIKIPDDEGLISELQAFQYTLSDTGKIKVEVPQGMTDDRVMSLALAVWNTRAPVKPISQEFGLYGTRYN